MAEELIYRVSVDTSNSIKTVNELITRNKELKKALEEGTAATKEQAKAFEEEYRANNKAIKEFRNSLNQTKDAAAETARASRRVGEATAEGLRPARDSYNALREEQKKLLAQLRSLSPKDTGFASLQAQVKANQKQLDDFNRSINSSGNIVADYGSGIKSAFLGIGQSILAGLAIGGVTSFIGEVSRLQAELSDLQADVRKTVGLNERQVQQFTTQLQAIDTRTSLKGLFEIAKIGGQLGLSSKDILGFVDSIDKAVVALGDEFSGGAEEVTKVVGGLRNVLTDFKTGDTGADLLKLSNALNALGASGSATAPVVSDFASRIGGVGIPLGLTSGQVLGLSATLQELNVTAERGGSAVIRILQKMASEPQKFAQVAGIGVQEFTKLVNTDLFGAFQKVAAGANKSSGQATVFADVLKELDVDGIGASEVLSKLGSNMDLLNKRTTLATSSLKETTSVTAEFAIKNETYAAQLEKAYKRFGDILLSIGGFFSNAFGSILIAGDNFLNFFRKIPEVTSPAIQAAKDEQRQLNLLVDTIKSTNTSNESRKILMQQLNEQFPDFITKTGKITDENGKLLVTEQSLNDALKETNKAFDRRIFLLSTQEVQQEFNTKIAKALREEAELSLALQEQIAKGAQKTSFEIEDASGRTRTVTVDATQRTRTFLEKTRKEITTLTAQRDKLLKSLEANARKAGTDVSPEAPQAPQPPKGGAISPFGASEKDVKAAQKTAKELLDIRLNNIKEEEELALAKAEKEFLLSQRSVRDVVRFEDAKEKIRLDSLAKQQTALENATGLEREERSKATLDVAKIEKDKLKIVEDAQVAREKAIKDDQEQARQAVIKELELEEAVLREKLAFAEAEVKGLEIQLNKGLITTAEFQRRRKEVILKFAQESSQEQARILELALENDTLEKSIELQGKRRVLGEKEFQKQLSKVQKDGEIQRLLAQQIALQTQYDNAKTAGLLTLEQEKQFQNQILKVRNDIATKTNETELEQDAKRRQNLESAIGYVQQATQLAFQFTDLLVEQSTQKLEERKNAIEQSTNESVQRVQALESELQNAAAQDKIRIRLSIQQEKERQKQLAEETKRIDKQIAEEKRRNAITQAIINTALSVTAFLAQGNIVASIAAGIAGAIQVATISGQKFEQGGLVQGNSHQNGGVKFGVRGSNVIHEMEGGEYVVNKQATRVYRHVLDAINFGNYKAPIANYNSSPRKFASGGIIATSVSKNETQGALVNEVRLLRQDVNTMAAKPVVFSFVEFEKYMGVYTQITSQS